MSATIFQGPDGDWLLDGNKRLVLETDQVIVDAHKLRNRFKFFEGTWFLDLTEGFPYFREIFVKNPDIERIRRLFTRLILSLPSFVAVERLDLNYDRSARHLSVYFESRAEDGRVVSGGPGGPFRIDGEDL